MIPSVHVGALLALAVLLLPMALAGLHLPLHRLLFFSLVLFVSLALAVHLTPFLPPFALLHPPPPSCLALAHRSLFLRSPPSFLFPPSAPSCPLRRLTRPRALALLNGSRLLLAGDSQTRLFALRLLSLLAPNSSFPFRRHADFRAVAGPTLDFIWAPFESNLTRAALAPPADVLVMGSGLWHMLHCTNASAYGAGLRSLARAVRRHRAGPSRPALGMFWLGMPDLVTARLNTEEKRQRMGREAREAYGSELKASGLLRGHGGPFVLLDIGALSSGCGEACTEDGMHYGDHVYDAAVQVMLNVMAMESDSLAIVA